MPKMTPSPLSFNRIMIDYLENVHKLDPAFFPALVTPTRTDGRLFFNLVLPNQVIINFPTEEAIVSRLAEINIDALKSIDPVISLATINTIQQFANELSTLITNSFLTQFAAAMNIEDYEKLKRIVSNAVTYKVFCTKEGSTSKDNIRAKIIAAILGSSENADATYLEISAKYQAEIISRLDNLTTQYNSYLANKNAKLAKATLTNIENYLQQVDSVTEFQCLDDKNKEIVKTELTTRYDQLKAAASLAEAEKPIQKGHSLETSTPSKISDRPSPRRSTSLRSLSSIFKVSPRTARPDTASEQPSTPKSAGTTPRQ